ncbi:hypothetical protein ACFQNF_11215 [Iodobacter arcticus]|uniref:EF-hand domain-containing protein n=1 Tax=Iodobacter arcticus TaxID=590593 RepID=A0ABW2QY73_9NEIS
MNNKRPIYFAPPREIYDALESSQSKATLEFLHLFLNKRGHILGGGLGREELIRYLSNLPLSYFDIDEIARQLESPSRKEKSAAKRLSKKIDVVNFQSAVDIVRKKRSSMNEGIDLIVTPDGKVRIKLIYTELQLEMTHLRQNKDRESYIELYSGNDGSKLVYPDSKRVNDVVSEIVAALEDIVPELKASEVDLYAFEKKERTLFFQNLINGLEGFIFHDLLKVSVNSEIENLIFDEDEALCDTSKEDSSERIKVEDEVKAVLKRAALDGSGMLTSVHLKNFLESGFYLYRVVWQAIKKGSNGDKYEFEALLKNPVKGEGFVFHVRGKYNCKKDGGYAATRLSVKDENDSLLNLLEGSALIVYKDMIESR